jgi:2,4-dienoyl-CoA reductase-like NADH-dependent reductase (Old Yellow Enzyme family)
MATDPFSPLTIGPVTARNRFVRSGANEMMVRNCLPTQALLRLHRDIAAGGVGMTTLSYIAVSRDGRTFDDQGVIDEASVPHYRAITDAVHREGALASAQITHAGSFVQHKNLSTSRAMSASGGIDQMGVLMGRSFQRGMTRADMDRVRDEFVAAALRCADAGFDAVELHMGHGYLLNQFISPLSNRRRDAYGGSAQARIRYPAEILAAVKAAVGDRLAVIAKINLMDSARGGATIADGVVTARALEAAGADMLVLSAGRNIESVWQIFGSAMPYDALAEMQPGLLAKLQFKLLKLNTPKNLEFRELYLIEAARQVREAVSCRLAYVGGVMSRDAAQEALDAGFDAVVMARALVHDPGIVDRFRRDPGHRSACTACNRCVAAMYGPSGTHCPVVGNALPEALNRRPAGEELVDAA